MPSKCDSTCVNIKYPHPPDRLSTTRAIDYYITFLGVSQKDLLDSNSGRYLCDDIAFSSEAFKNHLIHSEF